MRPSHLAHRIYDKVLWGLRLNRRLKGWSDKNYITLVYFLRKGRLLNLKDPKGFNEKIQWLKLYDRNPLYTRLVDKYEVKDWVSERIGSEHVIPLLGVWDSFDQIDFDALPDQFVLKCTHDSGGLVICEDKATLDLRSARAKIERSLARNYFWSGREWPYLNVKPRIIAEVYFPTWSPPDASEDAPTDVSREGVIDYKFYCFDGVPQFLYVSQGLHNHQTARMGFFTPDWEHAGFRRTDYLEFETTPAKPANFDQMLEIAARLSEGIPFVRVDLFNHRGQVLFSEMTFHPVSGMMPTSPRSADLKIGALLTLPRSN